jgi:hypothetical protein
MKVEKLENLILLLLKVSFVAFGYYLSKNINHSKSSFEGVPKVVDVERKSFIATAGKPFTLGNIEYTVLSVEDKGKNYGHRITSGKFIVITIQAKNVGKEESGVSKIFVKDSKARRYEENQLVIDTDTSLSWYGRYTNFSGIPASFSETYYTAFEVAGDSEGLELVFPSVEGLEIAKVSLGL